jgi:2-keto-3-deoxy-L-rhamnonate aldolase RhmA
MVEPLAGFWLQRPNASALEIGTLTGFRLVVIDMEHGAITAEACDALVGLGLALQLTVLVRVASPERILIQQALDYGAHGVMLPMIRHAQHASEVSACSKYAPLGNRGVGSGRAFRFGAYQQVEQDHHAKANVETRCHVMIETARALEEVEAIAALPTVDGVFVGPSDLSLARGRGAFRFTSADEDDHRLVAHACRRHGKLLGLPAGSPAALALARAEGAAYVTLTDDLAAHREGFLKARALLES